MVFLGIYNNKSVLHWFIEKDSFTEVKNRMSKGNKSDKKCNKQALRGLSAETQIDKPSHGVSRLPTVFFQKNKMQILHK